MLFQTARFIVLKDIKMDQRSKIRADRKYDRRKIPRVYLSLPFIMSGGLNLRPDPHATPDLAKGY